MQSALMASVPKQVTAEPANKLVALEMPAQRFFRAVFRRDAPSREALTPASTA
jgi:hypothetical protein